MLSYGISAINLVEFPVIHKVDNVGIFALLKIYNKLHVEIVTSYSNVSLTNFNFINIQLSDNHFKFIFIRSCTMIPTLAT